MAGMRMARTHSTKAAGAYAQHGGPGAYVSAQVRADELPRTHGRVREPATLMCLRAEGRRVLAARHGKSRRRKARLCCGDACAGCGDSFSTVRRRPAAQVGRVREVDQGSALEVGGSGGEAEV